MKFLPFAVVVAGLLFAVPGRADEPPPFPKFTFKREKAPVPGARRGPLVQISPSEPQAATPSPDTKADEAKGTLSYGWFWDTVPTALSADGIMRLHAAMNRLSDPPEGQIVTAPRLQAVQDIARAEGMHILRETVGTRVSPALVLALIFVESSGRDSAVSDAGAQGLMQLMPDTARRFGVTDSLSASQNIRGGVAYLDWLMTEFGGDVVLALAGYNAGENAVKQHAGVPPFAETRDYIPKVLAAYEVARGLCKTRPQLITDACALDLALN